MADGVAEPLGYIPVRAAVHRDDPPVAILLVQDRDVARALHDAVVAAVRPLPHQRRHAVGQTTLTRIGIQIRLVRTDAVTCRGPGSRPARVLGIRQPAVGRIDYERRLREHLTRTSVILPCGVVFVAPDWRILDRSAPDVLAIEPGKPPRRELGLLACDLGHLFLRQRRAARQRCRTL